MPRAPTTAQLNIAVPKEDAELLALIKARAADLEWSAAFFALMVLRQWKEDGAREVHPADAHMMAKRKK